MKKFLHGLLFIPVYILGMNMASNAQCGAGTTRDTLNWDYLDFLPNSGTYVSPVAFLSLSQSQNQQFTFGTQRVTVTHNYSGSGVGGDVATHTGETGSFGKGADIRFRGNGVVSFTFKDPVQNLRFSLHDVDYSQVATVSALNGALPVAITASNLPGSILTVTGNGSPTVVATASATTVGNSANTPGANATLNIEVTGTVTSVSINVSNTNTVTGEDGSYYISDLSACSAGTFPVNYYHISKPFTGQPAYFLAVKDNQIFYVDVATGVARILYQDTRHTNINSLAYDPYRHMVYYAFSLTNNSQADKRIYRYDYDMDTMGIFIKDVNAIGIPTFQTGVESGAAAFYDGAYYLGIEGNDQAGAESARESIIWRVDLNGAFAPTTVAQVWATPVDDGAGNSLHDWSDIGINDGILYDFDGASGQTDFYHKNLLTGACVNIKPSPVGLIPRQVSVTWQGQMYNSGSPSAVSPGYLVPYNGNGTVNSAMQMTMRYQGVAVAGSWGDAGEAFKPKTDFGDAPASYDPAGIDPGTHERNDSIRLGNSIGIEWNKRTSPDATGDGAEEDAVTGLQIVPGGLSSFVLPVQVLNRTNRNATLAGWIDGNGNGIYEPFEGATINVPPNASVQTINLFWPSLDVSLPASSTTFMRLRVATSDQGVTVNKPNGYFDNGEIEDHMVTISLVLPDQHMSLQAQKNNNGLVNIRWDLNNEVGIRDYELQRSCDGQNWETILIRPSGGGTSVVTNRHTDSFACYPVSFYRVKANMNSQAVKFSEMKRVEMNRDIHISLTPNPVQTVALLTIESAFGAAGAIIITEVSGRRVYEEKIVVNAGVTDITLPVIRKFSNGTYQVSVYIGKEVYTKSMIVSK